MGKRGGSPVIVAASVAVVVGMALAVLWQWAESRSTIDADPTIAAPADPRIALATPVLSTRRAPGVLARRLNLDEFAAELDDVAGDVDATSCLSVSVNGQTVLAHHASVPVVPASTMKLIVAAVALDVLGPGFRFTTSVNGVIGAEGVVDGDLTLLGGGDPLLSTEWWPTSQRQTEPPIHVTRLEDLADQIVSAGVTRVAGRIVGDGSRYDDEFFAPSWGDDIRVIEAGPYDALLVNDGRTSATSDEVTDDPALGAAEVLVDLLRDRGVRVVGGAASATMPFSAEIASITSQPLADIVDEMLQTSDDNTAEMLVKEIGLEVSGAGSRTSGIEAIMAQLLSWGVPIDGVLLVDGSGLSREDRVPCQTIVGVLARGEPDDALGAALPVAAVSGTLADQFVGSPVQGRLQAKTGTLTDVKSLAGYLPVEGGGTIEFALVQNTAGIDQGGYLAVWDELADALVTYPEAVREDDLSPLGQSS
ncbi:MAG: D-alanyl-D-alanine carboxypeptidase/D-alanyl-D-alanine-endopeptidase [Ilumatobacteraceae bacterium]